MPRSAGLEKLPARRGAGVPAELAREWARTYAETPYRKLPWYSDRPYPAVARAVEERWWPAGAPLLDIGCGAGTNSLFLARSGYRTTGVDLAPGAIAAASRRAERVRRRPEFREGDVLALPFRKGSFAGAIDVGCFHALPVELRPTYVAEVARLLGPGGRFLLNCVARETTSSFGPPHRLSVHEIAGVLEPRFLFREVSFLDRGSWGMSAYSMRLERRSGPQPPPR